MLDGTSGAYLFGPKPSVAPFAFHLVVFPPLNNAQIDLYEKNRAVHIPSVFKGILHQFNGLRAGRMSVYGLHDISFQKNPAAEAAYVPFDAIQERNINVQKHRPYAELFPIGGVGISDSENGALVLASDGMVFLFNAKGEVLRSHSSVEAALEDETSRGLANAA
jgi:hypothetical protein